MSDGIRFRATIELGGKTATGIPVPDEVVAGSRPVGDRPFGHRSRAHVPHHDCLHGRSVLIPLSASTEPMRASPPETRWKFR